MEEKILQELQEIKKLLQDIRSILEPKTVILKAQDVSNQLSQGKVTINQIRNEFGLNDIGAAGDALTIPKG